jgi:hypothetical protein
MLTFFLLQILWVNLHIFFFLGLFLILVFLCESLINNKDKGAIKQYFLLLAIVSITCLINPFGIKGALVPLTIFKKYGYMLAENQSVIFMQKRFHSPAYYYFEFIFALMVLSFIGIVLKRKMKNSILPLLVAIFFSAFSWRAIRGIPMFGLFFIPVASVNFYSLVQGIGRRIKNILKYIILILSVILVLLLVLWRLYYSPERGALGIGLLPGSHLSAYFFKQNKIEGPIFNNYDIGGYLIYHLFPEHKVFVDNRPEAYSVSFFKDTYVPMQEDENMWKKVDKQYNFNAIYFYRHDFTPWAQPFLIKRLQDPLWAPVFVDNYTLILLKRNEKNKRLIQSYELPKSIFQITKQ